ncbi:MAG: cbb3-type cytochrome c oxidase subunit I [Candidatus Obscuribacterales bacterium]|nr:cbb3-type cytochrome c oxidase subunit I [Candidatus Obscuribacterales bacterium]
MNGKNWWQPLFVVMIVGLATVMYMGICTYQDAPPIPDFVDSESKTAISREDILAGQVVFQKYALMDYGSMFGDGGSRGPDFTAEALHNIAASMNKYYKEGSAADGTIDEDVAQAKTISDLKTNNYTNGEVLMSAAEIYAFENLVDYYQKMFTGGGQRSFSSDHYINNQTELRQLSSFFFWGAWVCAAERPSKSYSYTHNWPYDPAAGNLPSAPVLLWSVLGSLGLMVGIGFVLYLRGRLDTALTPGSGNEKLTALHSEAIREFVPSPTQLASYKFFAAAAILFLLQVLAGALTIHDFIKLTHIFGVNMADILPVTITRSWHIQLSLFWISACWIGASIFVLPMAGSEEPKGQLQLMNLLFGLFVLLVLGSSAGIFLGPMGYLNQWWHLLGHQGWEFVELGKLWQVLLFVIFLLWAVILYRGVKPIFERKQFLALPSWIFYSVLSVLILFCSGFVATPRTNFVIADFWRWCVIHMWVEAFFEVFTTSIVAYFMYFMGLVSRKSASRVVYLATLLFLGSGIIGISHNFYWNAKPIITLALGSVFSTLQVIPLLMLTLDAWRFRKLPAEALKESKVTYPFGQADAFLFLLAVNFWNFLGAGVFGFIINLPIVNYYEHGTYLTVNHGHAALMGVYGNLALASLFFCCRYLVKVEFWNSTLISCAFWSLNIGLLLMVVMDLFPVGILQLSAVLDHGLWYGRSQIFIDGTGFQTFTWLRAVGGYLFLLGGVIPICWFMMTRFSALKVKARGNSKSQSFFGMTGDLRDLSK